MGELADRRLYTDRKLDEIRERLKRADALAATKGCVYVTGSFGRLEACQYSDLDLFIVGKDQYPEEPAGKTIMTSMLPHLDEICITADLIHVTRDLSIPEFSGDGEYLKHYSVDQLTRTLGTRNDDHANTFTARLLLLLESSPLVQPEIYGEIIQSIVDAYWRDFEGRDNEFVPAFLTNDILRFWRTLCVNYEAHTKKDPPPEKAKRRLKNYKLKHSRLLTCYSAILYLLAVFEIHKTVRPTDAVAMARLTPTRRLEWLLDTPGLAHAHGQIARLLEMYETFLCQTNAAQSELLEKLRDKDTSRKYMDDAHQFGENVFDVLTSIGGGRRFHKLLVV